MATGVSSSRHIAVAALLCGSQAVHVPIGSRAAVGYWHRRHVDMVIIRRQWRANRVRQLRALIQFNVARAFIQIRQRGRQGITSLRAIRGSASSDRPGREPIVDPTIRMSSRR
jgi:hypothetical protein